MTYKIARNKNISFVLIFSLFIAFFTFPMPAEAGMLGSFLKAVKPYAKTIGKIGGAALGAAFCGAFMPPLGLIAGGIAGWIAGGILTGYSTGSLKNLATIGGVAAGAMAMASFGPIGYVAGGLIGGFLGRKAMGLLQKADNATTGGILLAPEAPKMPTGDQAAADMTPTAEIEIPTNSDFAEAPLEIIDDPDTVLLSDEQLKAIDQNYKTAYENYVKATRQGNASNIKEANEEYKAAFDAYKKAFGKEPAQ